MSFYIAIAGEKRGPIPAYRIIDQLRSGEISPDVLGWEQGMAEWLKLREIPSFSEAIERLEKPFPANPSPDIVKGSPPPTDLARRMSAELGTASATPPVSASKTGGLSVAAEVKPFTRFWARSFDYMLVTAIAWQFCEVPPLPKELSVWDLLKNDGSIIPQEAMMRMAGVHYAAMAIWHVIEGLLLHVWGTTPGKAIFSIRLTGSDGVRLSLGRGLARSFLAWGAGLGFGLFPFNLLGMALGLTMLLTQGTTIWDRALTARVHHQPMTLARILVAVGGFFLLMIISSSKFAP